MLTEILIVVALVLVNGGLAMSELAVVSARPARLRAMADRGSSGAAAALTLSADPGKFLSSVQIGITAVGVLSGAFSGATLGIRLSDALAGAGMARDLADPLGIAAVVIVISYLSLILGELVPKRLALRNPEAVAARVAPAMRLISIVAAPLVWFLDVSGRVVLRLLGQSGDRTDRMTDEEIQVVLSEAHADGVIEGEEREMLSGVMRLADRSARALMTPRNEVETIPADLPPDRALATVAGIGRSRIPVRGGATGDDILGVLFLSDVLAAVGAGRPVDITALMRQVPVVHEGADALTIIGTLRRTPEHMALVYDEYGAFQGVISTGDILESITGAFRDSESEEEAIAERADGSLLVAGSMPADEFCDRLGLPRSLSGDYDTVAGIVLHHLQRLPHLGDSFTAEGHSFEVVDMDGRRVDKVLVTRL